jgi:hypothetical protein
MRRLCGHQDETVAPVKNVHVGAVAQRIGPAMHELQHAPDLAAVPSGYVGFGFRTRGAYG